MTRTEARALYNRVEAQHEAEARRVADEALKVKHAREAPCSRPECIRSHTWNRALLATAAILGILALVAWV